MRKSIRLWWYKQCALGFVNRVLADHGHPSVRKLLPGRKISATLDPVARTLRRHFSNVTVTTHLCVDGNRIDLPAAVKRFIFLFDTGEYPELVKDI